MRGAAMSVWIFMNLLCFGMCGYLYLIWSQYWMYIEKQKFANRPVENNHKTTYFNYQETYSSDKYVSNSYSARSSTSNGAAIRKNRRSAVGVLWSSAKHLQMANKSAGEQFRPSNNVVMKTRGGPRFPNTHQALLEFDSDTYVCDDYSSVECETKTSEFKRTLLKEFHRVLMGEANVFKSGLDSQNSYNVQYERSVQKELLGHEVLCALSKVPMRLVSAEDEPFKSKGFRIPAQIERVFKTCAVASSSGALLGSRLGEFIDSHDMVLRFNNAPTENYADDVGSKTTYRILNSQVVTKPEFRFSEDPVFRNISILIWDPANYTSDLHEWFQHPDFPLFDVYKRLLEQTENADVHLLHPKVLWDLWTVLQDSSPYRLRRNPPSSGFIGLWFSLHRCRRVRMFEYVPSTRATRRCHYHVARNDTGCTLGSWHPLAQEKALAERIRDNSDLDVFQRGFIDVPGFRNVQC